MITDWVVILRKELELRRWLFELCTNAQTELKLSHFQIGYALLEKAQKELFAAKQELEKSD